MATARSIVAPAADSTPGAEGLRLPRPPGVLRRFTEAHPRLVDGLVALASLAFGWVQTDRVGLTGPLWQVLGGWYLVVNVLTAASLLLRRSRPLVPLVAAALAGLVLLVDHQGPLVVPLALPVYSLAVHRSTRAATVAAGVLTIEVLAAEYATGGTLASASFFAVVCLVLALLLGAVVGDRRRYVAALIARASQLAEERDQRARLEVAAERARISRELHDVVAHSLSVMVRLSDGAEAVAETDPARSRAAVQQVGRVGRESLRDMRRLLGVLGDDAAAPELAPQPGLADLDALVETYRSTGLPVVVERSGATGLDRGAELVVYRCVQEGLTNALRYARSPGTVLVRLDLGRTVEVEVAHDGAERGPQPSVGLGRGLAGLQERAALYGGTVEAGPRDDLGGRGWRTRLRIEPGLVPPNGSEAA